MAACAMRCHATSPVQSSQVTRAGWTMDTADTADTDTDTDTDMAHRHDMTSNTIEIRTKFTIRTSYTTQHPFIMSER